MLIENYDSFLSDLTKLFNKNQANGKSLYISMKRWDGRTKKLPQKRSSPKYRPKKAPSSEPIVPVECKCLIRAELGKKKISTVIAQKDVNKFQVAYSNLLKGNLYGLKKKKKTRSKDTTSKVV